MAGTLLLPGDRSWLPAGWVYDNALERMAAILVSEHPTVAGKLLESRTGVNGGYLDLRGADTETIRLLLNAANKAYEQCKIEGANSFHMPHFYSGFMQRFAELLTMLHSIVGTRE